MLLRRFDGENKSVFKEGTMSETLQEKNKTLLIKGFNTLFNERNFTEAEKLWSPNYIQHSGHIPPGRDGLFTLVKGFPAGTKWDHGIIMAEGDYVMVHSRYSLPDARPSLLWTL